MYRSLRPLTLTFAVLLHSIVTPAQSQEVLDIAARYPGENALIRRNTEHLVVRFDDQRLRVSSDVHREILLLSDLAPGIYHTSSVYHSAFHQLKSLEGWSLIPAKKSYKPVKASILKSTNVESENILFDDNKASVLGFNGLTRYAATDTRYTLEHTQPAFLPVFYLQYGVPTLENTFSITTPKTVHIKAILRDIDSLSVKETVTENKTTITRTWSTGPVSKYKEYSNGPSYPSMPRIIPYISDYTVPGTTQSTQLLSDIPALYRFLYQFISKVNQTEDPEIRQKVKELTKDCTTDSCKAAHIYRWVQDNIRYIAFEDSLRGFIPREAALVYERRYGDCKDMSSLLVAMCRAAGLKAYLTWIGTRHISYALSEVPLPQAFNHMICTWEHDNNRTFMDGTHTSIGFGIPPYALQGKDALISIDADRFEVVKVPESDVLYSTSVDSTYLRIGPGDELLGRLAIRFTGHDAWNMKTVLRYSNEKDKEKMIKSICSRGSNKYFQKSKDYRVTEDQVFIYSDFSIADHVQRAGRELFINLNLQQHTNSKIEDLRQRKVPVENKYKAIQKEVVTLEIPKGYEVSYLPPDTSRTVPGMGSYSVRYQKTAQQVICIKEFRELTLYIAPAFFEQYNRMIDETHYHDKETISLVATGN